MYSSAGTTLLCVQLYTVLYSMLCGVGAMLSEWAFSELCTAVRIYSCVLQYNCVRQ
jgi:hypothetical protein